MFGAGAMTNSIPEIRDADLLFVIGSNTTEAHPIIAMEMKRAARRGAKLITFWMCPKRHGIRCWRLICAPDSCSGAKPDGR